MVPSAYISPMIFGLLTSLMWFIALWSHSFYEILEKKKKGNCHFTLKFDMSNQQVLVVAVICTRSILKKALLNIPSLTTNCSSLVLIVEDIKALFKIY